MLNEITEQIEPIKRDFCWEEERFPFSRQDLDLSNDEAWEYYYGTVEKFDEELGGVPFTVLKQILMMTWAGYGEQAFIDLLNEPTSSPRHIITFFEKEFRQCRQKNCFVNMEHTFHSNTASRLWFQRIKQDKRFKK